MGGASSTEMGQLFEPLAVLSHHLHCYNNGLRTRKAPSHIDGRVTPHYTTSLTATAEEHPNTVLSAPLRHPSVSWYGAHRHPLRMWAAPPPQSSYGALPPRGRQCTYGPTAHPSFNTQQASIVMHPIAPVTGGGGCSGDTCLTQAFSVYPAVCFNGSLFLYTPDWCVLVA